jgi:hypothetical protein
MSKKRTIIILGLVVAILPFSGLPSSVWKFISVLAGLTIAALAFLLKRRVERAAMDARNDTFSQSGARSIPQGGIEGVEEGTL